MLRDIDNLVVAVRQGAVAFNEALTNVSPFSFVIFGGSPAGRACWKTATSPVLAASYIRPANAMTSGESVGAPEDCCEGSMVLLAIKCFQYAQSPSIFIRMGLLSVKEKKIDMIFVSERSEDAK